MTNYTTKKLTLVLIVNTEKQEILLGMKKRGFGEGWWNGFGGKLNADETIEECAVRETQEECGLHLEEYAQIGYMIFEFVGNSQLLEVSVFRCDKYSGVVKESEEMRPKWFKFQDVPFDQMWPDDYLWYPHLFKNQKFRARFLFKGHHEVLDSNIKLVETL